MIEQPYPSPAAEADAARPQVPEARSRLDAFLRSRRAAAPSARKWSPG